MTADTRQDVVRTTGCIVAALALAVAIVWFEIVRALASITIADAPMLRAIILVCSLTKSPDCTIDTATDVIHTPVFSVSPSTCALQGQAVVAQTEIGRELTGDDVVKVVCVRVSQ